MTSTINLTAIIIADAIGIVLLLSAVVANFYSVKEQMRRNPYLVLLTMTTLFTCFIDAIIFALDGKPGVLNHYAVHISNTFLYLTSLISSVLWMLLIAHSIRVKITKLRIIVVSAFIVLVVALLTINLFTPILFRVNENNVYQRVDGFYGIYSACYFGFMIDVVVMYLYKKKESGGLKFFPIWAYIIPLIIGMVIQNTFYGVSTIGPFMTVSITSITMSFQSMLLYMDKLTGLYNRYYLTILETRNAQASDKEYTVIMIDVNGFKSINDTYGHKAGDEALIHLSNTLTYEVDKSGEVIRYAGDEFVIIYNSTSHATTEALLSRIRVSLANLKERENLPYDITFSAGMSTFHFGEISIDDIISRADNNMYENKRKFYEQYHTHDRRKIRA